MYFTFSGPVQLPGVILAAGTYEFEIANPLTSGDIVRVRSRDGRHSVLPGVHHAGVETAADEGRRGNLAR